MNEQPASSGSNIDLSKFFARPVVLPHSVGYKEPQNEHECHFLELINLELEMALRIKSLSTTLNAARNAFMLENGRFYAPVLLPDEYDTDPMSLCFANAQQLVEVNSDLTYVEGLGFNLVAVPHAWCIDRNGCVVDTTWSGRGDRCSGTAYFGVPLDRNYVIETYLARGEHNAIILPGSIR